MRVGNGAADQHQLDVYGWVLDAAWLFVAAGHRLYSETWRAMRGFADEVRGAGRNQTRASGRSAAIPHHHVHSKLMAWLALDRALRIAATHRTPTRQSARWQRGARRHPRRREDSRLRPRARHLHPSVRLDRSRRGSAPAAAARDRARDSPRVRGTIDAIAHALDVGEPLIYRYPPGRDGLPGIEGAFVPCAFWLVQALALTGRAAEAERAHERAACTREPTRALWRGDRPSHESPSRQLPAGLDPCFPHPSGPRTS